jgi:hypothetical protein
MEDKAKASPGWDVVHAAGATLCGDWIEWRTPGS